MTERSNIEWTDSTFNPWEGCQKVGPGCDHCYAETRNARFGGGQAVNWGPGAPRRRTSESNWNLPYRWNAKRFMQCNSCGWRGECAAELIGCGACGSMDHLQDARRRVFCASLSDVFDNAVDPAWRRDLFKLIAETPNLDWLIVTKRIGNVVKMVAEIADRPRLGSHAGDLMAHQWRLGNPPKNVWLGATIVNQPEADRDIPRLLAVPAAKRFLSMEPLLGPVALPFEGIGHWNCLAVQSNQPWATTSIDWVIVGGESGPGARPMHPDWARTLRDQCAAAGVPFLFKQWGEWGPYDRGATDGAALAARNSLDEPMQRFGKKVAGRLLDGVDHNGFPA